MFLKVKRYSKKNTEKLYFLNGGYSDSEARGNGSYGDWTECRHIYAIAIIRPLPSTFEKLTVQSRGTIVCFSLHAYKKMWIVIELAKTVFSFEQERILAQIFGN